MTVITPDNTERNFDAFARLMRLDEYPNQPEIVDWPMTELEYIEMQTLEALAAGEISTRAAENYLNMVTVSSASDIQYLANTLQEMIQQQAMNFNGNVTINITVNQQSG